MRQVSSSQGRSTTQKRSRSLIQAQEENVHEHECWCLCVFPCLDLYSHLVCYFQGMRAVSLSTTASKSASGSGGSESSLSYSSYDLRDKAGREHVFTTIGLYQVPVSFTALNLKSEFYVLSSFDGNALYSFVFVLVFMMQNISQLWLIQFLNPFRGIKSL